MVTALELTVFYTPIAILAVAFILTSISLLFRLRCRFPARVNCWFCNTNSWVPYTNRNSFECPNCQQYNGFTNDGDYNKDIVHPRRTSPRPSHYTRPRESLLCHSCTRNQELKVQQLASFVPRSEDTFDEEVTAYEAHLEDAYRLCPACEVVLRRQLNTVKRRILGTKLSQGSPRKFNSLNESKDVASPARCWFNVERLLSLALFLTVNNNLVLYLRDSETLPWILRSISVSEQVLEELPIIDLHYLPLVIATIILMLHMWGNRMTGNGPLLMNIVMLSCLTMFRVRYQWLDYLGLKQYYDLVEWTLHSVAAVTSIGVCMASWGRAKSDSLGNINDSFHRIEWDEDNDDAATTTTTSISESERLEQHQSAQHQQPWPERRAQHAVVTPMPRRSENLFDVSSVAASSSHRRLSLEDEEIQQISLNSPGQRSLNKSDPIVRDAEARSRHEWPHFGRTPASSVHTLSPKKMLHADDSFSSSIRSMKIGAGDYQIMSALTKNNPLMANNPFMKDIALTRTPSEFRTQQPLSASSRHLLTPSRLSLMGGAEEVDSSSSARSVKSNPSWLAGGFWNQPAALSQINNNHHPPTTAFSTSPPSASSLDCGLNEIFLPIAESRSSSQSSGFESRQSTSSYFNPLDPPPVDSHSVFSEPSYSDRSVRSSTCINSPPPPSFAGAAAATPQPPLPLLSPAPSSAWSQHSFGSSPRGTFSIPNSYQFGQMDIKPRR